MALKATLVPKQVAIPDGAGAEPEGNKNSLNTCVKCCIKARRPRKWVKQLLSLMAPARLTPAAVVSTAFN